MKKIMNNRNMIMVVAGQLVSVFGNSVLRFALPLYILDTTGSAAVFGTVLAVSGIPSILFSPVGGILADRVSKRNIMVILDAIAALIILISTILMNTGYLIFVISVMMVLLSGIQALYQPSVQAILPEITEKSKLDKANSTVSMVNALSNLMAPLAAGMLYGAFGIIPIMVTGVVCFASASFMELFISARTGRIQQRGSVLGIIKGDLSKSSKYIVNENPVLLSVIIVVSLINLMLTSMIVVGLPTMIKVTLGLSDQLYGVTQGFVAIGMIAGGTLAYTINKKIKIQKVYLLLVSICFAMLPVGMVFSLNLPAMASFWIISISVSVMMMLVTMFSIKMMTFVQKNTPAAIMGKVISFIMMMTKFTLPVGQAMFGYLFDLFGNHMNIIVFASAICSSLTAVYSKRAFSRFRDTSSVGSKYVVLPASVD